MCSPTMALAAAASIGGQLISSNAQQDAADRQQRKIEESLALQDQYSKKAESTALENANQYTANDRLKNLEETKTAAGNSLASQLTASRDASTQSTTPSGRLSQAFLTGDASAKADQLEKSIEMAKLMGNMRGSGDMLTNEGYKNADYASKLGLIGRNAQGSANASQVGINSAGQVDSGSTLAGGLVSGLGTSYLGSKMGSALSGMFGSSALKPGENLVMMGS